MGFSRANLFGKCFDEYRQEAQAPLLVAMIEHVRAVENMDSILAVDGLDATLIGPYDLSASMGLTAQFDHPEFLAVMDNIREKAKEINVAAGVHVVQPSEGELKQYIVEGYQFLVFSIDAVFLRISSQKLDV